MKIPMILFLIGAVPVVRAAGPEAALQSSVKPLPEELRSSTKANEVREQIKQDVRNAIAEAKASKPAPQTVVVIQRTVVRGDDSSDSYVGPPSHKYTGPSSEPSEAFWRTERELGGYSGEGADGALE